jgi:hypothetical protein
MTLSQHGLARSDDSGGSVDNFMADPPLVLIAARTVVTSGVSHRDRVTPQNHVRS